MVNRQAFNIGVNGARMADKLTVYGLVNGSTYQRQKKLFNRVEGLASAGRTSNDW